MMALLMHYFSSFGKILGQTTGDDSVGSDGSVGFSRLQIGMQMGMSIWLYLRVKAGLYKCNPPGMQLRAACSQNMSELVTSIFL